MNASRAVKVTPIRRIEAPIALVLLTLSACLSACERKSSATVEELEQSSRCGPGFVAAVSGRCCVTTSCSEQQQASPQRIRIPARRFELGASDWEAEGKVPVRWVQTRAFEIDAYELSEAVGRRARSRLTRAQARALCREKGGRLPTDDEWLAAAGPHRYPWGNTGLVCRRAAWGIVHGPCAHGATGPDTVGAHPDGASAEGVHDLIGNVAEWVETADGEGRVRGGSYADDFAANLRSWAVRVVEPDIDDPRIGARCAYDGPEAE